MFSTSRILNFTYITYVAPTLFEVLVINNNGEMFILVVFHNGKFTQMICPRIDRLQSFLEILLRKKDEENNSKGYPARIHLIAEVDPDKVQARFISSPSYEFYIFDVKSRTNSGFVD